jgi:hypothetical protein
MSSKINIHDIIEQEKSLAIDNILKQLEISVDDNSKLKRELSSCQKKLLDVQNDLKEYKRICHDIMKR